MGKIFYNKKIENVALGEYEGIIPPTYLVQIRAGKFYAGLLIDVTDGVERTQAIFVTYSFENWLEIVWIRYEKDDLLPTVRADLLKYLVRSEQLRYKNSLKGAFCEIHTDEISDPDSLRHAMVMSGFEIRETVDSIYEFTLSQVNNVDFLLKAAKTMVCRTLGDADEYLLDDLETMIDDDERPVPVGQYVRWGDFLDMSVICIKNDRPCGLLLLSEKGKFIVIECVYVTDRMALAVMLGNAFSLVRDNYGGDQGILVPVLLEKTGKIVEKFVPSASRGRLIEGIRWF